VNSGILNVSLSLGSEFLSKVCGVLVLDVLDNWVPASVVVHLVAVTRGVDDVESETNAILLDDMGNSLNLSGGSYWLIWGKTSFGIDKVGCEDGVNECGLSETGLT
jgi:hypothetical protein